MFTIIRTGKIFIQMGVTVYTGEKKIRLVDLMDIF